MYAGDAARLGIEALLKGELGECYELGSDWTPIQIYALAQTITLNMTGKEALIHVDESRVRPIELWSLQADNQRVYELTDLRPTISLAKRSKQLSSTSEVTETSGTFLFYRR